MVDCIFCKVAAGLIPSQKVAETEELFAFEDINPQAPTHVLIVPKKHMSSSLDITAHEAELMGKIIMMANDIAIDRGLEKSGFRILTNTGSHAGQSVFHLHFHLLGGRRMEWPPG
ncbi:MAG: histidine triad nucleotide-binding protein [Nitrospinae bacterium]|nr:histidine triad nucleotide-binding protein [Nitrospinota bacterium]